MTVAQLIEYLQTMPPDALVVTEGYEEGFDTIKKVSLTKVIDNPQKEWYTGEYMDSEETTAKQVVLLFADTKADKK